MVAGVDDDRVVDLSAFLERPQQLPEPPVAVAQAVVIIVDEAVPAFLVVVAHDAVEEIVEADDRTVRIGLGAEVVLRSEEHTSELQSLMRRSYAVFCLTKN